MKQISGTEGEGNNLPLDDFSRKLAEAEHMLRELRNRNFGKNLREAEAEKREAHLRKDPPKFLHTIRSNWFEIRCAECNI